MGRGAERSRDIVTPSNRRRVSSWKAEHAAPSIQKGSELGSPAKKMVDCLLDGDIWWRQVKGYEERVVRRGDWRR